MRIRKLRIHNYRSISELDMECLSMVTLLGPNNHGKSNVLAAIEFCLTTSNKPTEQDFFIGRSNEDNNLWVELTFNGLTEQERNTFKKYVLSDETICIRKTAQLINSEIVISYNGYVEEPKEEWLRSDKAGEYASKEKLDAIPLKDIVSLSGRLTKKDIEEAQQKYIENHQDDLQFLRRLEEGPLLGSKNVAAGILPDFYLIPAVRDLTDEIKVKTTTTFGRLLNRAIQEMAKRNPVFIAASNQLKDVVNNLNNRSNKEGGNEIANIEKSIEEELSSWDVKVNIEVTPPELERLFELGTDIQVNDGVKTPIDHKGNGLQRAMMFAFLRVWSKVLHSEEKNDDNEPAPRKQSQTIIFAIEELELFLHPQAQRKLARVLRDISETKEHQVFICTHSTNFVDLEHYKEIAIIAKDSPAGSSHVRQCITDLFEGASNDDRKKRFHMAHWINPDRGEMFFAKKVIFVEGDTEKCILPFLAEKLDIFDHDISIIDCGSKHNLPLYIVIANAFNIPYLVIHDEDPLPNPIPDDWNEDKKNEKKRTFALNTEIRNLVKSDLGEVEVLAPEFEGVSGISKREGQKKGKALAALDFFENADESEIPHRLKELVEKVYDKKNVKI